MVSKKSKKKKKKKNCFSQLGKTDMFGEKVAIFDWEWGLNSGPREGQKRSLSIRPKNEGNRARKYHNHTDHGPHRLRKTKF